jgi:hypothetical protein
VPWGLFPFGSEGLGALPLYRQQNRLPDYLLALRRPNRRLVLLAELDLWDWANNLIDTHRFATAPLVGPDGADIPARLIGGLEITRRFSTFQSGGSSGSATAPVASELYGGRIEAVFSSVTIANPDGELDSLWGTRAFDGRRIRLLLGVVEVDPATGAVLAPPAYADLIQVARATMGQAERADEAITVRVREAGIRLQDPLQLRTFGGTGGADGTPEIQGNSMAVALGKCRNVLLTSLDPFTFTYHIAAGPIQEVQQLRSRGEVIPIAADYARYDLLPANADIPVGQAVTSLGGVQAVVRFGTQPLAPVTADILGDNGDDEPWSDGTLWSDGTGWLSTRVGPFSTQLGSNMRRLLVRHARLGFDDVGDESFVAYDHFNQDESGWFVPVGQTSTAIDILIAMAEGVGAALGEDGRGRYIIRRIDPPGSTASHAFSGQEEVPSIVPQTLPWSAPPWSWEVGYNRVWHIQTGADVSATVHESVKQRWAQEWRKAPWTDSAIKRRHAASRKAPFFASPLLTVWGAAEVRERLRDVYGVGRERFLFEAPSALFQLSPGDVVNLTDERHGLAAGRNLLVEEVRDVVTDEGRYYTQIIGLG